MPKLMIEFISGNARGIVEGSLSVDTEEVERIECRGDICMLIFPGIIITVPLDFCDQIREAINGYRAKK